MVFNVDTWWNSLNPEDQNLALHWRDASPLPPVVVQRLAAFGVMASVGGTDTPGSNWSWSTDVQRFLKREAGDPDWEQY